MKNEEAKEAKKDSLKENLRDISVQIDRLFITVILSLLINFSWNASQHNIVIKNYSYPKSMEMRGNAW